MFPPTETFLLTTPDSSASKREKLQLSVASILLLLTHKQKLEYTHTQEEGKPFSKGSPNSARRAGKAQVQR